MSALLNSVLMGLTVEPAWLGVLWARTSAGREASYSYTERCVPSQNGVFFVRLQPHSFLISDCVMVNFIGANAVVLCDPSQNG
jgi:hypothetical protein